MESVQHAAAILTQLFVLLVATKIGDEIFKRIGQPTVVGEIVGGVIVGPAVLNLYQVNAETALFAEIGVVLLLFKVGLDTRLHELLAVGRSALLVATLGVIFPLAAGFGLAEMLGAPLQVALFLGAALTATSVGITSKVLDEIHGLHTVSGRVILGAAVADDVMGLVILAIASGVAAGNVSPGRIATLLLLSVAFIVIVVVGGTRILRRRRSLLTVPEFAETPFLPGMIVMLGLAALSAIIGLAAIIGSFLAGMVVGESSEKPALEQEVAPVAAFFTPFFFGFIGAQVDLAGLASFEAVGLLLGVTPAGRDRQVRGRLPWLHRPGAAACRHDRLGDGAARRGGDRGCRAGADQRRHRCGALLGGDRHGAADDAGRATAAAPSAAHVRPAGAAHRPTAGRRGRGTPAHLSVNQGPSLRGAPIVVRISCRLPRPASAGSGHLGRVRLRLGFRRPLREDGGEHPVRHEGDGQTDQPVVVVQEATPGTWSLRNGISPSAGNGPSVPVAVYAPPMASTPPSSSATTARQFQPAA